jgi:hypothetical protein
MLVSNANQSYLYVSVVSVRGLIVDAHIDWV